MPTPMVDPSPQKLLFEKVSLAVGNLVLTSDPEAIAVAAHELQLGEANGEVPLEASAQENWNRVKALIDVSEEDKEEAGELGANVLRARRMTNLEKRDLAVALWALYLQLESERARG